MLLVPLRSLRPGMVVGRAVQHPLREDLCLLSAGFELNEAMIDRLSDHRISHVWLDVPGLEDLVGSENDEVERRHLDLYRVLDSSIDRLERRVDVRMHVNNYRTAVHGMLAEIVTDPTHDVVTHRLSMCGPTLAGHMANCSYLSLLIGAHLSGYLQQERRTLPPAVAENTAQLGLGALLHDIGKLNMPDELRDRWAADDEGEWPEYRLHVSVGHDEVREHVSPVAAAVVMHHHERFEGGGFPGRKQNGSNDLLALSGRRIHVFARIVAVVDAFDHLMHADGKVRPTLVALAELESERFKGWFDPVIVEALKRLVPPFLIGTFVELSDGTEGVVVQNHPEAPCRPTVRLVQRVEGGAGFAGDGRQLDLRMCRGIDVAKVDGTDVSRYLYRGEFEATQAA
ncbi:MAG: HD domain-containing phosphohydrolase [Planctomycetota bacterium]